MLTGNFTEQGKALLDKGAAITFTRMQIGETGKLHNLKITNLKKQDDKAYLDAILDLFSVKQGFFWRECGLYALDPDVGEILYCYAIKSQSDFIAPVDSGMMEEILVSMVVTVGSNTNVNAIIDDSMVFASKKEFNPLKEKVEDLGISVKEFGAKGDGIEDDTLSFQDAINYAQQNNKNIFIPHGHYLLEENVTVKEHVCITGYDAIVVPRKFIVFEGNSHMKGITIDGTWNIGGINVIGENCTFENNTFKNIRTVNQSNYGGQTIALRIFDTANNTKVINNKFDGLMACIEESDIEALRTARMIRVEHCENVLIKNNIFTGSNGNTDTDYIHIASGRIGDIEDDAFPFCGSRYDYKPNKVIEGNIFYYKKVKSVIKVQSSGVSILNNTIYVDGDTPEINVGLGIRIYNSTDCKIEGNTILNKSQYFKEFVVLINCKNIVVDTNIFTSKVLMLNGRALFRFDESMNVTFRKNKCSLVALNTTDEDTALFHIRGVVNLIFSENVVDIEEVLTTLDKTFLFYVKPSTRENTPTVGVKIQNNIFNFDNQDKSLALLFYNEVYQTSIKNNEFNHKVFVTIRGVNGFELNGNYMRVTSAGFYSPSGNMNINDIVFINNIFDNRTENADGIVIHRSYLTITGGVYSNNTLLRRDLMALPLYCTGVGSIWTYEAGSYSFDRLHSGATGTRPTFDKKIGYNYYDNTLNKAIIWDGTKWIDTNGTTV